MAGEAGRSVKIEIKNVKKEYHGDHGTTVALNGVSLHIMGRDPTRPPPVSAIWTARSSTAPT